MKNMIALLLLIFSHLSQAQSKTCTAVLDGTLKPFETFIGYPYIFLPNDAYHSVVADWTPIFKSKAVIIPSPVYVECGVPKVTVEFEPVKATGVLPEFLVTSPWMRGDKIIPSEKIYGNGVSGDYSTPPAILDNNFPVILELDPPYGVKDICDVQTYTFDDPLEINTELKPEPYGIYYQATTADGLYRWDKTKNPAGQIIPITVEKVQVNLFCASQWEYELEMEWPYEVTADNDSMCGAGQVNRKMSLKGHFMTLKDSNEVIGYVDVEVPTVTYSGSLWGAYTGSKFSLKITGHLYSDEVGESWVAVDMLQGGDGITWNYSLTCPYGVIKNSLFGAVREYFWIYNVNETLSEKYDLFFKFPAKGEDREFVVDKGGQGKVTFRRKWKRVE